MHVEIWSDVVCPWCGIGQARLDAALKFVVKVISAGKKKQ